MGSALSVPLQVTNHDGSATQMLVPRNEELLRLWGNVVALSENVTQLTGLRRVFLSSCPLSVFPAGLLGMPWVASLDVRRGFGFVWAAD